MSKRIIIISGGELNEEFVLSILEKEENQYVIGVDRGMEFLCRHQILPNYIVGDFDSVKKEIGIITAMRRMFLFVNLIR